MESEKHANDRADEAERELKQEMQRARGLKDKWDTHTQATAQAEESQKVSAAKWWSESTCSTPAA